MVVGLSYTWEIEMEKQENRAHFLLAPSLVVSVISFALCIYLGVRELSGELVGYGLIMLLAWVPCVGLVLLDVIVYLYGCYCMKAKRKEFKKMSKSTWVFGIWTGVYMAGVNLVFALTDLTHFAMNLVVVGLCVINLGFLVYWVKVHNKA